MDTVRFTLSHISFPEESKESVTDKQGQEIGVLEVGPRHENPHELGSLNFLKAQKESIEPFNERSDLITCVFLKGHLDAVQKMV